jgi:hypothetical protein
MSSSSSSSSTIHPVTPLTETQQKQIRAAFRKNFCPTEGKEAEGARDFVERFKLVGQSVGATPCQLVKHVPVYLEGKAARWYARLASDPTRNAAALTNFTLFTKKLIDWFDPEPTESTAIAALSNCRIGEHETIKDHLIRFSELVGEAGDSVTPRMILHFYMASLRTKTKEWLEDINGSPSSLRCVRSSPIKRKDVVGVIARGCRWEVCDWWLTALVWTRPGDRWSCWAVVGSNAGLHSAQPAHGGAPVDGDDSQSAMW